MNPRQWKARLTVSSDFWSALVLDRNIITCSRFGGGKAESFTPRPSIYWSSTANDFWSRLAGRTQWVRNAEAAGEVTLKKGRSRRIYRLRPIADTEKPALLKAYLDSFKTTVQRYFPVPAGSAVERFAAIASNYPVFELAQQ